MISALTSEVFTILVGPDKIPFYIHSDILAQSSEVLAQLVQGSFQEPIRKCAVVDDIDPSTFSRAAEYMYSSDYSEAKPQFRKDAFSCDADEAGCVHKLQRFEPLSSRQEDGGLLNAKMDYLRLNKNNWHDSTDLKNKALNSQDQLIESFHNRWAPADDFEQAWREQQLFRPCWLPFVNMPSDGCQDFSAIFLCHAQLYVFANRYSMPSLAALALSRLGATLSEFQVYRYRTSDLVKLLKYTYESTQDLRQGIDKLRFLVLTFCTYWIDELLIENEFIAMLESGGALSRDIILSLSRFTYE